MQLTPSIVLAVLLSLSACGLRAAPVTNVVDVLKLMRAGQVAYNLSQKAELHDPPSDVFQLRDGLLHISGRGYGYLATTPVFRDYHLVVEFKWTGKT